MRTGLAPMTTVAAPLAIAAEPLAFREAPMATFAAILTIAGALMASFAAWQSHRPGQPDLHRELRQAAQRQADRGQRDRQDGRRRDVECRTAGAVEQCQGKRHAPPAGPRVGLQAASRRAGKAAAMPLDMGKDSLEEWVRERILAPAMSSAPGSSWRKR